MTNGWGIAARSTPEGACSEMFGPRRVIRHFGDPAAEYAAIRAAGVIVDRADRAVLRVSGTDRAGWLHNLTTHDMKALAPNHGRYAFALDAKGRILFDLTALAGPEAIWADMDVRWLDNAIAHFNKYIIVEDVALADASADWVRLTVAGAAGVQALETLVGACSREPLVMTEHRLNDHPVRVFRDGQCGVDAIEVMTPPRAAELLWQRLAADGSGPLRPAGRQALDVCRIEAGIPWPLHELTDDVLPAETLQLERAVSFTKGCYLGQEVVERMRTRGGLARKLVGLDFARGDAVAVPTAIEIDGRAVGTLTSFCDSPHAGHPIGLGYLRPDCAEPGTAVRVGTVSATTRDPALGGAAE